MGKTIFGYTHVNHPDVKRCPCGDPGNYMSGEQPGDDPLVIVLRCWCGSTNRGTFDSMEERAEFLKTIGVE